MASHLTDNAQEKQGHARAVRQDGADKSVDTGGGDAHPLLALQRQVGNAQIQRMLAQREAAPEEEELQMKRDASAIQREAAPEEEELQTKRDTSAIQREAAPEEEELQMKRDSAAVQREAAPEEEELQMKRDASVQRSSEDGGDEPIVGLEGGPVTDAVQSRIQSKRGGGSPLGDGVLSTMENSFGESFADVRVHNDGESDKLNRSLGAKAFTTGSDIFFRQDASPGDHALLGHELTHVVQQRSGAVSGASGMTVGPANDAFESAADAAGATVAGGGAVAQTKRDND